MTAQKKITYTFASVAPKVGMTPKGVRAKFRRLRAERPFDHRKVKELTPAQFKAAVAFLKTDHRNAQ